jgi:hypothetical protein
MQKKALIVRCKRTPNKLSFRNPLKAVRKSKRQAPRSGALFFRPFLLGTAKEMDKRI